MDSRTSKLICFGTVLALSLGLYLYLNRGYGEISELGYQYATALYSACNQTDDEKLEVISEMVIAASERQELEEHELRWLQGIIELGRQGDWRAAAGKTRQLLSDQVKGA